MLLLRTLARSSVLRQQPPVCDDPGLNVLVQEGSVEVRNSLASSRFYSSRQTSGRAVTAQPTSSSCEVSSSMHAGYSGVLEAQSSPYTPHSGQNTVLNDYCPSESRSSTTQWSSRSSQHCSQHGGQVTAAIITSHSSQHGSHSSGRHYRYSHSAHWSDITARRHSAITQHIHTAQSRCRVVNKIKISIQT
jgi:hypothetical protein